MSRASSHSSHSHSRTQLSNSYFTYHATRPQPFSLLLFSDGYYPSNARFPLYAPAEDATPSKSSRRYDDLMKTVDYRYVEGEDDDDDEPETYRRSSFALSDIFEDDEHEIQISNILPSSPQTPSRQSSIYSRTSKRSLSRFASKIIDFFAILKKQCRRAGLRAVTNAGHDVDLDLLS